jgi:hypothetical protein
MLRVRALSEYCLLISGGLDALEGSRTVIIDHVAVNLRRLPLSHRKRSSGRFASDPPKLCDVLESRRKHF